MALRLPSRIGADAEASESRSARSAWIAGAEANRELPLHVGQLRGRQVAVAQTLPEEAGQIAGPLGMAGDDPRRGLLEAGIAGGQERGDLMGIESASVHLVERDECHGARGDRR